MSYIRSSSSIVLNLASNRFNSFSLNIKRGTTSLSRLVSTLLFCIHLPCSKALMMFVLSIFFELSGGLSSNHFLIFLLRCWICFFWGEVGFLRVGKMINLHRRMFRLSYFPELRRYLFEPLNLEFFTGIWKSYLSFIALFDRFVRLPSSWTSSRSHIARLGILIVKSWRMIPACCCGMRRIEVILKTWQFMNIIVTTEFIAAKEEIKSKVMPIAIWGPHNFLFLDKGVIFQRIISLQ